MAKALIAAVALAVVLVAAVVVPLVVLPGSSGFNDWPSATPQTPHTQDVDLSVPVVPIIRAERSRPQPVAPAPHRQLAQAAPRPVKPAPQPQPATQTPVRPKQPLAAPEAPLPPPVVDARDASGPAPVATGGRVQPVGAPDGTNEH